MHAVATLGAMSKPKTAKKPPRKPAKSPSPAGQPRAQELRVRSALVVEDQQRAIQHDPVSHHLLRQLT